MVFLFRIKQNKKQRHTNANPVFTIQCIKVRFKGVYFLWTYFPGMHHCCKRGGETDMRRLFSSHSIVSFEI